MNRKKNNLEEKDQEVENKEQAETVEKEDKNSSAAGKEENPEENTGKNYDELYDKYIRLYSEFDNFRKRTRKEMLDAREVANVDMMRDFLPILDDFERAINNLKGEKDSLEGIILIYQKFKKTLQEKGLKEMEVVGKEFDPEYHEALTKIPAPSKDLKGKVVDEIEKGYLLGNKIVRYAKVVVGE